MPYDHSEVARQIQDSLTEAQRAATARADATEQAVEIYDTTPHQEWIDRVEQVPTKRWIALPQTPLHEFPSVVPAGEDYSVVATDSSFIAPDKHRGSYCYMVNVGGVMLQYGPIESRAELGAAASHRVDPLVEGEEGSVGGRMLQTECAVQELKELRRLAAEYTADLAMLDGSLMQFGLAISPQPEARALLTEYYQTLREFEVLGVPVVGYVSRPASQMVMYGERILACADHAAGKIGAPCERMCNNAACSGLWTLDDGRMFAQLLSFGERSPVFRLHSTANIPAMGSVVGGLGFCYIRTRYEIARLEFPLWIVERGLLDRLHSVILRQCDLGDGYPLALTLAHNYAVLRSEDRESYFFLLERAGLIDTPSEKATGKRSTGGRI